MNRFELTGSLAYATIGIVVVVLAVILLRFLRKPQNRHPMDGERERNIGEIQSQGGTEIPLDRNRG